MAIVASITVIYHLGYNYRKPQIYAQFASFFFIKLKHFFLSFKCLFIDDEKVIIESHPTQLPNMGRQTKLNTAKIVRIVGNAFKIIHNLQYRMIQYT